MADVLRYRYQDGDDRYVVTYARQEDLTRARLIDGVHGIKRLAATLAGFDGAYLRFSGECRVQYFRAGALVEEFADKANWGAHVLRACAVSMCRTEWQRQRGCG